MMKSYAHLLVTTCWIFGIGFPANAQENQSASATQKRVAVGDVLADVPMREIMPSMEERVAGRRVSSEPVLLSQLESKLVFLILVQAPERGLRISVPRASEYIAKNFSNDEVEVVILDASQAVMPDSLRRKLFRVHEVDGYHGFRAWWEPSGTLTQTWGVGEEVETILIDSDRRVLAINLFQTYGDCEHDRSQVRAALDGEAVIAHSWLPYENHPLVSAVLRQRADRLASGVPSNLTSKDLVGVLTETGHEQAAEVLLRLGRGDRESLDILREMRQVFSERSEIIEAVEKRLEDYHPVRIFSNVAWAGAQEGFVSVKLENEDDQRVHVWFRLHYRRRLAPYVEFVREYDTSLEPAQEWRLSERLVGRALSTYGDFEITIDMSVTAQPDKLRSGIRPEYRHHLVFDSVSRNGGVGSWPDYGDDEIGRLAAAVKRAERLVGVPSYGFSEPTVTPPQDVINRPAPLLDVGRWIGEPVDPEQRRGKVVLLEFWGTWCGACTAVLPDIADLYRKYKDQGLIVVGVHSALWDRGVEAYLAQNPLPFPVAVDAGETAPAYGIDNWPTAVLIDQEGVVRWQGRGRAPIEEALRKLLRLRPL